MSKLAQPTPVKATDRWKWLSILFLIVCFFNENYDLIMSLGIPAQYHNWLRFAGLVAYYIFTKFTFSQTTQIQNHDHFRP